MTSYIPSSSPLHTPSRLFAQVARRTANIHLPRLALFLAIALFGIFGLASPATAQEGPVVTITDKPPAETESTDASFTFTTNQAGNSTCTFDGVPGPCSPDVPVTYSGLSVGTHNFVVEFCTSMGCAYDGYSFTVVEPAPFVTITDKPPAESDSTTASFTFTTNQTGDSTCALTGQAASPCSPDVPVTYSDIATGSNTFYVSVCTSTGCVYDSYEFWVLGPPPVVTITEAPEATTTSRNAQFRWDVEGLVDWSAQCSLDGQAFEACADFFYHAYYDVDNGEHTFVVRTCGTFNGTNPATRECVEDSHTWTRVAPVPGPIDIKLIETPDATTFDTSARFRWETTGEQLTGVSCSLDGEAFGRCYTSRAEFEMKGKDYADLAEGKHDFVVRVCGLVDGVPSTDRCAKDSYTWTVQLRICAKFQSKDADGNLVNGQSCAARAELLEQVPEDCKTLVEDYKAGEPDITCPVQEQPPVEEPPVEEPPVEEPAASIIKSFAPKFQVRRATVSDGKLDMLIDTTARANGDSVDITYRSNGRDFNFKAPIADSKVRFRKLLPKAQRGLSTGIVTVRYAGGDYKGFPVSGVVIRTRAASGKAELRRNVLSLNKDGVLVAQGGVTDKAKGVVRLILSYDTTTGPKVWEGQAEIQKSGSWKLKEQLPTEARRGGHLSIQFTGYLPKRIRGEQITKQVLAGDEFVSAEDATIGSTD